MIDYIENLKLKPEHVRRRFAFLVSFSFTFLIFAGWMASYSLNSSPVLADKDANGNSIKLDNETYVIGDVIDIPEFKIYDV